MTAETRAKIAASMQSSWKARRTTGVFVCLRHELIKSRTPSGKLRCSACDRESQRAARERARQQNGFCSRVPSTRIRPRVELQALCPKHGCKKRRGLDGAVNCHLCEREKAARLRKAKRSARKDWDAAFAKFIDPHYYDGGKHERQWKRLAAKR